MTTKAMTTPLEALEACIEDLQTIRDGFSDDTIALAKAAIPVAELHEQAVELLVEDHNIALHGKHALDWLTRRNALLTQREAPEE